MGLFIVYTIIKKNKTIEKGEHQELHLYIWLICFYFQFGTQCVPNWVYFIIEKSINKKTQPTLVVALIKCKYVSTYFIYILYDKKFKKTPYHLGRLSGPIQSAWHHYIKLVSSICQHKSEATIKQSFLLNSNKNPTLIVLV